MKDSSHVRQGNKGEPDMDAQIQERIALDLSKLRSRSSKTIPTESALQGITPINWSEEVLAGKRKVHITKATENN